MSSLDFYKETLESLIKNQVQFMIVGGYAVNSYGFMRSTGDMDIWINIDLDNLDKIATSIQQLGYKKPDCDIAIHELKRNKNISLKEGEYFKVEFISLLSSQIKFDSAFERKVIKKLLGLKVPVVGFNDLCELKLKSGRDKDLLDVHELRKIRK